VVGEEGTFTRAGRKLNLSQSAISRQISILEGELKTPLFHRTSQGLVFTEAGQDFFNTVNSISDKLAMGLARLNEQRERPEGPLRITTTVTFGSAWLSSRMTEFHQVYPDISVSLILADNLELDLLHRQADCAIRFKQQTELTLVQRYLRTVQYHLYGSRAYFERRGFPTDPVDLDTHDLIVYGDDAAVPVADMNRVLTIGRPSNDPPRVPTLCINSVYGIFRAISSGLGIGALPQYIAEQDPEIVQVLPEYPGPTFEVYFVYPEELRHSKRIDALKTFLVEHSKCERRRVPRKRSEVSQTEPSLG